MLIELKQRKNEMNGEEIKTIYFGGGTPSVLSKKDLDTIFETINLNYTVSNKAEITLEANPEDLTETYLAALAQTKVNRLSIGIQSFTNEELVWMNRNHTAEQSEQCVKLAQQVGFDNISVDLIYGSKFQDEKTWGYNLQKLFDLNIPHFSAYNLTVEEKTVLGQEVKRGKEKETDENKSELLFNKLQEESFKHGFIAYEISNFGKAGYFSRHNTSYWKGVSYIGIGPAAHSFHNNKRRWNVSNNAVYINKINSGEKVFEEEVLTSATQFNEYIMTGLRTIWGCDLKKIEEKFGKSVLESLLTNANNYISKNMLNISGNHLILTGKGKLFADRIASDLFII